MNICVCTCVYICDLSLLPVSAELSHSAAMYSCYLKQPAASEGKEERPCGQQAEDCHCHIQHSPSAQHTLAPRLQGDGKRLTHTHTHTHTHTRTHRHTLSGVGWSAARERGDPITFQIWLRQINESFSALRATVLNASNDFARKQFSPPSLCPRPHSP